MSIGKTRIWVIISFILMLLTAQSALLEPLLLTAQSRCGENEACGVLALFRPAYIEPLVFGLMLLTATTAAAGRLPAIGASGIWSLMILALGLMSFGAIQAIGDDPASLTQAQGPIVALAAFGVFLMICPDTLYRGYKTTLSIVAWCGVWAALGLTIWSNLAALAEPLRALPQTTALASNVEALLGQAQGPLGLAQSFLPVPVDTVLLAALSVCFLPLLFRKRGRTAQYA